jgi:hypothetical protein
VRSQNELHLQQSGMGRHSRDTSWRLIHQGVFDRDWRYLLAALPKRRGCQRAKRNRRTRSNQQQRKARSVVAPLHVGRSYHALLEQVNPTTGKKFTMKEAAAAMGVTYATFRNLEALWRPAGRIRGIRSERLYDEYDPHDEDKHENEAHEGAP